MASLSLGGHHCLPSSSSSIDNNDIISISRRKRKMMMSQMVTRSSLVPVPALLALAVIFSSSSSTLDRTLSNVPQILSSVIYIILDFAPSKRMMGSRQGYKSPNPGRLSLVPSNALPHASEAVLVPLERAPSTSGGL